MLHLYHRLMSTYEQEGLRHTIEKSIRFFFRHFRHLLGKKGLHRSSLFHDFLIWWNSGRGRYSALADPFKIIHVNPDMIEYVTKRGPNPGRFQFEDLGLIRGGKWDRSNERFRNILVVQALYERFNEEKSWENNKCLQKIKSDKTTKHGRWQANTDTELQQQCETIDQLYSSINKNGYLSKAKLVEQGLSKKNMYTGTDQLKRYNEVAVDIGRNGQFLFVDGRHRLAIAKILGIDEIPVRVSARHKEWQRVRERVAETPQSELSEEIKQHLEHPDLKELLDEKRHE